MCAAPQRAWRARAHLDAGRAEGVRAGARHGRLTWQLKDLVNQLSPSSAMIGAQCVCVCLGWVGGVKECEADRRG